MPSFVRPTLLSVLCAVAAFGHAPAWLHVAKCHGHGERAIADDSPGNGAHSCGCIHHDCDRTSGDQGTGDQGADDQGADDSQPHDSDSCPVCQSLSAPSGFVNDFAVSLQCIAIGEPIVCRSVVVCTRPSISWPPGRGPPKQAYCFVS